MQAIVRRSYYFFRLRKRLEKKYGWNENTFISETAEAKGARREREIKQLRREETKERSRAQKQGNKGAREGRK